MTIELLRKLLFALSLFCFCALTQTAVAQTKDWRPVTPEELSAKTPTVEPDADAEALFWEVSVDDSSVSELALRHYVRVKIFTERGREKFSKYDVLFTKGTRIKDLDARVTKPDGTLVQLKKEDIIERDILRANGVKVRAKTFALPGLEVGSVIEYRFKETIDNAEANMRLIFQRDVPIRTISYYVRPFSGTRGMYYRAFNAEKIRFEKDKNGFHRATMNNVPAFKEEPLMLPEDEVRSWVYIYYAAGEPKPPQEYWDEWNKNRYNRSKDSMKPSDEIKRVTTETIAGAATDEEKLRKIYNFTKTQIRNLQYASKLNEDEWKKALDAKNAADTLKLKYGHSGQIDNLFGAMARAAGYDVREAISGSKNEMTFDPRIALASLVVNSSSIAIKLGEKWSFYSPGSYYAPFGMLSWAEEGQRALITDPKAPIWVVMELAPPEKSREIRTGKFRILQDGTLEGEAKIEYTGHLAEYVKLRNRGDSASEREKTLKDLIKSNILGTAEIESAVIENSEDPEQNPVYKFKIRVLGYASRTGKRIFFQPNVFERSSKPRFVSSSRKHDVYFNYPYSETDDIAIEIPSGFQLENADAPTPLEDSQGISSHKVMMGVTTDGKMLVYKREFAFGKNGFIRFPVESYTAVKSLFEAFNKSDVHQLTLRETATVSTSK